MGFAWKALGSNAASEVWGRTERTWRIFAVNVLGF